MTGDQTGGLIWGVGALVLVLSAFAAHRAPLGQTVKMVLAWVAIFVVAALIVGQRDQIGRLWSDAFGGNQQVHGGAMRIAMAEDGHFWADATVNGRTVRFLIDSGATTTAMSRASAAAARVTVEESGFPVSIDTANGTVSARRATIDKLQLGPIQADNLPIVVAEEFGDTDVLGMNFLSQMESWRVEGRFLVLQPSRS